MIEFREKMARERQLEIITYVNGEGIQQGINPFDHGAAYTDIMKTQALKQALSLYGFTAALGGGRRDEEKSRAKERVFSFRDVNHAWDPRNQRPELWNLYNSKIFDNIGNLQSNYFFENFRQEKGRQITLAVILVGENPASQVYVKNKIRGTEYVGMKSLAFYLPENADEKLVEESSSDRLKKIHACVNQIKANEEMGVKYMQKWEEEPLWQD